MPQESSENNRSVPAAFSGVSRRGFLKSLGASAVAAAAFGSRGMAEGLAGTGAESAQGPGAVPVTLTLNSRKLALTLEPRVTLLEALRVHAGLTGTKEACDRATCGTCTVLLNGAPVNACSLLAIDVQDAEITTIEGLVAEAQAQGAAGAPLTRLQRALVEHDGLQCGYCSPGFVLTLSALLKKNPHPTEAEVKQACAGNLCRCGSYPRIFAAAMGASGQTPVSKLTVLTPHEHALA